MASPIDNLSKNEVGGARVRVPRVFRGEGEDRAVLRSSPIVRCRLAKSEPLVSPEDACWRARGGSVRLPRFEVSVREVSSARAKN